MRDMLGKGGIPIHEFDQLTKKRIFQIMKIQEKRLEERNKAIEEQQRKTNEETRRRNKKMKF